MPWVRVDDHFNEHPKLAAAGPLAWALWLAGLAYCNRNLTDGFIPWSTAGALVSWDFLYHDEPRRLFLGTERVGPFDDGEVTSSYVIGLLVDARIWDVVPGGYRVHDYDDYQPTKAQVLAEREAKVAAGRAGGKATAAARAVAPAKAPALAKVRPVPKPVPVPNTKPVNALRSARENGRPTAVGTFLDKVVLEDVIG